MMTAQVLALSDFSYPFEIEADASRTGIGAVLLQKGHSVAFYNKKLCPCMQASSVYARELSAITEAVLK